MKYTLHYALIITPDNCKESSIHFEENSDQEAIDFTKKHFINIWDDDLFGAILVNDNDQDGDVAVWADIP